jgi:hypothetical protein
VLAPDRKVRVLTTAAPAEGRLDEVVGHVIGAGVDPFAIVGALPMLSCILGGRTLVGELASVARPLAARAAKEGRSLVMKARPMVNPPGIAAVMSLLQKCQAGNRRACMEAGRLTATAAGKEIYDEAAEHLLHAQASEALRRVAP